MRFLMLWINITNWKLRTAEIEYYSMVPHLRQERKGRESALQESRKQKKFAVSWQSRYLSACDPETGNFA
jgi:hypothetical protein